LKLKWINLNFKNQNGDECRRKTTRIWYPIFWKGKYNYLNVYYNLNEKL
jgi:hypothetical protein